eukprot:CAMPEP_0195633502 /NCGR_PEP_ID=MMETSP0815-20121206/22177_2 /TAXON_ID=97485 /ORGANISM="Prymnesium parvum, Strain Texoma1" /LENGTH=105 /DNA_ID=CAMNT_0040775163 /DNA_START=224 /DNA_END=537 /DNA_ORIENTATION=-
MSTSRAQAFSALVPRHAVETPLSSVARASAESVSRAQAAILAAALAASFSAARSSSHACRRYQQVYLSPGSLQKGGLCAARPASQVEDDGMHLLQSARLVQGRAL